MSTSVIVTCFNEEKYIVSAIESILSQTAADQICEILVVDDGSTDGSVDAVSGFEASHPLLIRAIKGTGKGPAAARNLALKQARGDYVAFLDGDDIWMPNRLELQHPYLDNSDLIGVVYGDVYNFRDDNLDDKWLMQSRRYSAGAISGSEYFVYDAPIYPSAALVRRSDLVAINGFNERHQGFGEDSELWIHLTQRSRIHHVGVPVAFKRIHGRNLSGNFHRHLGKLVLLGTEMSAIYPNLKPYLKQRNARLMANASFNHSSAGERLQGLKTALGAIIHNPRHSRGYKAALVAILPKWTRRSHHV